MGVEVKINVKDSCCEQGGFRFDKSIDELSRNKCWREPRARTKEIVSHAVKMVETGKTYENASPSSNDAVSTVASATLVVGGRSVNSVLSGSAVEDASNSGEGVHYTERWWVWVRVCAVRVWRRVQAVLVEKHVVET
jgi:hypothetical protein